ncbi:MAG TPA: glycosyltransferase family 39 protein [Acidimicrobiales bacterium]|nr:glycosyltransferase family 39 protein [Acidimicrobiales bacterium]
MSDPETELVDPPAVTVGPIRRLVSGVPRALWAVAGLWVALLLGASLVWPMSYGTDEPQHIDMAYDYAAHPFTFYGPGQLQLSLANVGMQHALPGYPPHVRLAEAPIPSRSHRPSFGQLGGHAFEQGGQPNQMIQHPPLYYWLEAIVVSLPGVGGLAWDVQVWLMRLLSVLIMVPLPFLCWGAARRLLSEPFGRFQPATASRLGVLAAALPLTVPNLIRDGSSVDNDCLLILATSVVLWGLARVVTGDTGLRTAAIVSGGLAVGLWSKGFALVLPPIIVVAYLVAPAPHGIGLGGRFGRVWRPIALNVAGGLAGCFWWVRNLVEYHAVQTNGFGAAYTTQHIYGKPDHKGTLSHFVPPFIDQFIFRIWGEVGLPDSPSPGPLIIYGWFFVALIGIVAALATRGDQGTRRRLAVLALVPAAYFVLVFSGSFNTFRQWAHDGVRSDQGRYIYGAAVILAALFAIGCYQLLRPRFHGKLALLVVAGAIVTNAATWLLILRSWYQPVGDSGYGSGTRAALRGLLRWSPLPEFFTVLFVIVLPVGAALGALWVLGKDARAWRPLRPAAQT